MMYICVDTPQSIKDEGNMYYDKGTDIFAEIFRDTEYINKATMIEAMWARYRYRMIGGCDTVEWVDAMRDRLYTIGRRYDALMSKADNVDLTDMSELSYERRIRHQPIDGTEGDVRTIERTGSNDSTTEHESLPQTATTDTRYLDARQTVGSNSSGTDRDVYTPSTETAEEYTENRDLNAITFKAMMDNYPEILGSFVQQFDAYFLEVLE